MSESSRAAWKLLVASIVIATMPTNAPRAQGGQGAPPPSGPAVTSIMTNPYRIVPNWPNLGNIKPGAAIGIIPDGKGGLWLQHRSDPAIVHIDAAGNVVKRFDVTFSSSHGLCQDRDGNFWALDASTFNETADTGVRGNQIFNFNQDGKLCSRSANQDCPSADPTRSSPRLRASPTSTATSSSRMATGCGPDPGRRTAIA
jgi:streptogramin lyase